MPIWPHVNDPPRVTESPLMHRESQHEPPFPCFMFVRPYNPLIIPIIDLLPDVDTPLCRSIWPLSLSWGARYGPYLGNQRYFGFCARIQSPHRRSNSRAESEVPLISRPRIRCARNQLSPKANLHRCLVAEIDTIGFFLYREVDRRIRWYLEF